MGIGHDLKAKMPQHRVGETAPIGEDETLPIGDPDIWGNGVNNMLVQPAIGVQGVKLNAAHRLMASDKTQELRNFVTSLSTDQQKYFFSGLPVALGFWFISGYKRNLQIPDIVLSSKEVSAGLGLAEFRRFITGMLHLREVFPPRITSGYIYRLTAIPKLPSGSTISFKAEEQFRALTSWTTQHKPKVEDRRSIQGMPDIILEHKLSGGKNVLFDYESVEELCSTVVYDAKFYSGQPMNKWKIAKADIEGFNDEKEVAIYLNAGTEISCTWRPS